MATVRIGKANHMTRARDKPAKLIGCGLMMTQPIGLTVSFKFREKNDTDDSGDTGRVWLELPMTEAESLVDSLTRMINEGKSKDSR